MMTNLPDWVQSGTTCVLIDDNWNRKSIVGERTIDRVMKQDIVFTTGVVRFRRSNFDPVNQRFYRRQFPDDPWNRGQWVLVRPDDPMVAEVAERERERNLRRAVTAKGNAFERNSGIENTRALADAVNAYLTLLEAKS